MQYKLFKRLACFFSIAGICCLHFASAQQRPHYTQYILNNYILNPAVTGIENYTDVKFSYRNQWVGFPGAPQTMYATIHAPIGKQDYRTTPTSFQVPGDNPRGKSYWEEYTAAEPHHGIGGSIINYKTGYISRLTATVSYAYHLGLGPNLNLSAGFAGGITTFTIDASKIELANPVDPAIGGFTSDLRKTRPELSAGLWLYGSDFFAGLSVQQIIPQRVALVNNDQYKNSVTIPHFIATAGYRFMAGDDINILPSTMVRYISNMPLFLDVNIKTQYRDKIWVGGNYRIKEGFAAMAGINVSNTFNIGYSYDINNANYLLQYMQRGTHEIVLGFLIGNKWGDTCPRRVW
jgi:type IX secretion system PorP/SprF family membrane protein